MAGITCLMPRGRCTAGLFLLYHQTRGVEDPRSWKGPVEEEDEFLPSELVWPS